MLRQPRGRIVAVDVARCLALLGMAATHIFPAFDSEGSLHPSYDLAAGRASALFAVLAGVSLGLLHGGGTPPKDRALWAARAGILARAALLFLIGFLLARVESPPLVILHYYALLFVVATVFIGLPARVLAAMAVVAAVATPLLSHVLRQNLPAAPIEDPRGSDEFVELAVTGTYPVLTWTTYLLAGMAVGRIDLRRLGNQLRLLVVGLFLAVAAKLLSAQLLDAVGGATALQETSPGDVSDVLEHGLFGVTPASEWRWLVVSAPHTGTSLDLTHTIGTSLAVLAACLLLARVLPSLLLLPFAAAGSMTLTLYTAHVLAVADGSPFLSADAARLWLTQVVVGLVFATAWRLTLGRGPLEQVSSFLDRSARRAALGEPSTRSDATTRR